MAHTEHAWESRSAGVRCHEMAVLDKYNVELDPDLFDTRTPEGYTEFKLTDILGMFSRPG